jgi:uncharacterized protein (UPF0332 family)
VEELTRSGVALKLEQLDSKLTSFLANYRARNPRECAASMYFAVFHAAEALLCAKGIEATSHKAVASLIAMHFVRLGALPRETSSRFSTLMAGRHDADYNAAILFGPEEARAAAAQGGSLLRDLLGALDSMQGAPSTVKSRKLLARIAGAVRRSRKARGKRSRPA